MKACCKERKSRKVAHSSFVMLQEELVVPWTNRAPQTRKEQVCYR